LPVRPAVYQEKITGHSIRNVNANVLGAHKLHYSKVDIIATNGSSGKLTSRGEHFKISDLVNTPIGYNKINL
jgi:hypothetical protein